jgi:hypothetical protein
MDEESLARSLAQPQKPKLTWKDVRMGNPLQEHAQDVRLEGIPAPKPGPIEERWAKVREVYDSLPEWAKRLTPQQ